jgi:double-strand break repair protein MRE11
MSSNTFKFLITTDNHLGYMERDARRGKDSFVTFEECLRAARVEHDVDAVLLAGDLFHENKPSLGCMTRTLGLLRKYVPGDKPVPFTLLSDPAASFVTHPLPCANFQDPNLNIALPIFVIHGNHDDPLSGVSAIDVLSSAGLVNYFGHVESLDDIIVRPILLQKGETFIALYGMGNVRDERLHRCFRLQKVQFVRPKEEQGRMWFNILLFHQNRGIRGGLDSKGGIPEAMLKGFGFDLVIWGNEHEQLMAPQPSEGFDIIQPGSTVMTSLSAGESNPKQYGILEVRGRDYRTNCYPLWSMRPVVRRTVELWKDHPTARTAPAVEEYLQTVVDEMIHEADEHVRRIPDDVLVAHPNIKFPLMRISVDFTDPDGTSFPQPNLNRFGQQYMDVVVNSSDMVKPIKPKPKANVTRRDDGSAAAVDGSDQMAPARPIHHVNTNDIRQKIEEVFSANSRDACMLLSEAEMTAAIYSMVEKTEAAAVSEKISSLLISCQKKVWKQLNMGGEVADLKPNEVAELVKENKKETNKHFTDALAKDNGAQEDTDTLLRNIMARQQADCRNDRDTAGEVDDADVARRSVPPAPVRIAAVVVEDDDDDDDDDAALKGRPLGKKAPAKRPRDTPADSAPPRSRGAKKVEAPRLQLSHAAPEPPAMQNLLGRWNK